MEKVSLFLIVAGLVIIAVVLVMRWRLRRAGRAPTESRPLYTSPHDEPEDYDPLFAVGNSAELGQVPERREPAVAEPAPLPKTPVIPAAASAPPRPAASAPLRRSPPRVAADPERVITLNVMAPEGRRFVGAAIAAAAQRAGMELGTWSIYHYYSRSAPEAPPLFSMANMVKPGSFDPERLRDISTVGLSLFMVPSGDEQDIPVFDILLATARQLASDLDGEVRDARRSVLTRQAIEYMRDQLNEWRIKGKAAQS